MKDTLKNLNYNLFLHTSDMGLTELCAEVLSIGEKLPEIHKDISAAQDARGQ